MLAPHAANQTRFTSTQHAAPFAKGHFDGKTVRNGFKVRGAPHAMAQSAFSLSSWSPAYSFIKAQWPQRCEQLRRCGERVQGEAEAPRCSADQDHSP